MKQRVTTARRATMLVTGIALATSFGLTGAAMASAAAPALKIKPGSEWTLEDHGIEHTGGCEVDTMASNGTFISDLFGDSGTWSGGGTMLTMTWTAGSDDGVVFTGTFVKTPRNEYKGTFSTGDSGLLIKGVVHSFHGQTC